MSRNWLMAAGLLLVGSHVFLAKGPIVRYAPTYDEPVHLTAGYVYLKTGDYRMNGLHHPAFAEMWAALPLLAMGPTIPKEHNAWILKKWDPLSQYRFADTFLYKNTVSPERMMAAGRWMQVVLGVILGGLVGLVAWRLGGPWAAIFAGTFWAFSPAVLANGTVVSTDLAFATFTFLFFASFLFAPNMGSGLLSGAALALCMVSKYFAIACLPLLFAVALVQWLTDKSLFRAQLSERFRWRYVAFFVLGFVAVFAATYRGLDISVFSAGFQNILRRSQAGRSSFFLGGHGSDGWLLYFPVLFLLKTPIPLLLAVGSALFLAISRKIKIPKILWIPPVLFFGLACASKVQIGHRYILMIYPFLFVAAGLALAYSKKIRLVGAFLAAWLITSTVRVQPHFLPYFNELIGGPAQGYRYFTDSNNDWGQALKELAAKLEPADRENGIYLSYFGVADPHFYGLKYYDVGSDTIAGHSDDSANVELKPTKFAISITNLQATYYSQKDVFSWLAEFEPWERIGHSIFVYDFKDHPEALTRLEHLRTGRG